MSDTSTTKGSKLPTGAVFYTDGSTKPRNPGNIGWSVHGYTFTHQDTTKGAGHPKVTPTIAGYMEKGPGATPADLVSYYDFIGWSATPSDNNLAEVHGCSQALRYAATIPSLKTVTVLSDSQYTVKGVNEYMANWVMNGWRKRDGSPVPYQEEWKNILTSIDQLRQNQTKFTVKWIKGHAGDFGNVAADHLAKIGSTIAMTAKEDGNKATISEASGYWKTESERHAMFGLRGWFFTVNKDHTVPGEYYLCNQVKSDEFIGRRAVDGAFGYVSIKEPDRLLELVRERQIDEARTFDTLALARIDRIYDKAVCAGLEAHGKIVLRTRTRNSNDLHFLNEDAMVKPAKGESGGDKTMPITEELYPALLALRCVGVISRLKGFVEAFRKDETNPALEDCAVFDITDTYFKTEMDKKGKPTKVFDKNIGVANQSITLRRTCFGREMDFQQVFAIHMLARNNLKRLENTDVRIWMIAEKTGPRAVRYSTVIRSNEDWSAWSGAHSNLIVFKEDLQ